MDNSVRIDYFAVTVKDVSPEEVLEEILLIPQDQFALNAWGINKYQRHYACSDIKVYFNQALDNMGVYLELKGQGCRQYEEFMAGNANNFTAIRLTLPELILLMTSTIMPYRFKLSMLTVNGDCVSPEPNTWTITSGQSFKQGNGLARPSP